MRQLNFLPRVGLGPYNSVPSCSLEMKLVLINHEFLPEKCSPCYRGSRLFEILF